MQKLRAQRICVTVQIFTPPRGRQRIFGLGRVRSYLLELLDGTLVNSSALVDQVTGGGGLSGIDVSDDNDVDVKLLLTRDAVSICIRV